MTIWILEPRDPLIARDGKPFGVGVRAATLPFPFPSTTTGTARTRAGLENGFFDPARQVNGETLPEAVKKLGVSGPLLVELNSADEIETWLMPAPMDTVLYRNPQNTADVLQRLMPLAVTDGLTNLKQAPHDEDELVLVGPTRHISGKPYDDKESPRFWRWDHQFRQWLCEPDKLAASVTDIAQLGHQGAPPQMRSHVAIDPDKFTAHDAQLFQTRGLEFTYGEPGQLSGAKRLALAIAVKETSHLGKIDEGLAPLGGESRLAAWRESDKTSFPDDCLVTLQDRIAEDRACRLILLTPAYFANGSSPAWLREKRHGVEIKLRAIAAGRERVVSGWDYALVSPQHRGGMPKPTRRLAPAGAVYFLSLAGAEADIKTWVKKMWMQCVSDDEAHRVDGFGLAALGVWAKEGQLQTMKMEGDDEKTSEEG